MQIFSALQVYVSQLNIDDDLVSSIVDPAQDPNAPDVFYRVISSSGASINSLLQRIKVWPLLLRSFTHYLQSKPYANHE